jgi:hypothetical protein
MYVGFSGAIYAYTCCLTNWVHICGKLCSFVSGSYKRGLQVCIGKWKGHPRKLHGVRKFFCNRSPLMCKVRGVSVMVKIHYNS